MLIQKLITYFLLKKLIQSKNVRNILLEQLNIFKFKIYTIILIFNYFYFYIYFIKV